MKKTRDEKLLDHALAIGNVEAQEAGTMAFSARAMVMATLPYRDPGDIPYFGRENGGYTLFIEPGFDYRRKKSLGYPYGNIPRLLLAWLTTEATRTKCKTLEMGKSLTNFLSQMGLSATGGKKGSIPRVRNQLNRFFGSRFGCHYHGPGREAAKQFQVMVEKNYWWNPLQPDDSGQWYSEIVLGDEFFQEIIARPVPLDLRVIRAIKKSPMALDIYAWLTYRMSYLKRKTTIPWRALALQFGSDFARLRDFKKSFLEQLAVVKLLYCHARFSTESVRGLTLYPSRPQVLPANQVP